MSRKQSSTELPAVGDLAAIADIATGDVSEGVVISAMRFTKGRWTVVLMTELGEAVGITDDDYRQKRKVLQFLPPTEPTP